MSKHSFSNCFPICLSPIIITTLFVCLCWTPTYLMLPINDCNHFPCPRCPQTYLSTNLFFLFCTTNFIPFCRRHPYPISSGVLDSGSHQSTYNICCISGAQANLMFWTLGKCTKSWGLVIVSLTLVMAWSMIRRQFVNEIEG